MAKVNNSYNRCVQYVTKITRLLIEDFWNNEIPMPTVTIQSSDRTYAHCTTKTVWHNDDTDTYEVSLSSQYLRREPEEISASIGHELVHEYCRYRNSLGDDIREVSANGFYHNKVFKKIAEEHGLIISKDDNYGWTITEPDIAIYEFVERHQIQPLEISRDCEGIWAWTYGGTGNKPTTTTPTEPPKKKNTSIKWICPESGCKCLVRSTKEVRVMCADHMRLMIKAE